MSKFKVRITRVETYYVDVEVEADSIDDAIAKVEDNEQDNEYADLFDCPDDVQTTFKDANDRGTYRLRELASLDIDSWVAAISRLSEFDKVRKA